MTDLGHGFAARLREDRRLLLLRMLQTQNDYTAHEHLLRGGLADLGHRISGDELRNHLAWLDEQGLLVLSAGPIQIATLTLRGEDVATGVARLPGVARPPPGR
ncbi:hypothetical protein [Thiocystis violascens]|uniref:ArsR family transcriptional regulator n=1 Tax=Thiocystis violascens (strain ATCC 17096 / DSM 198 / 6111) TaxID=765911 RepID=I3YEG6_THIV6|nr:hypothetical protein [Thiocystis violascens]AFL75384.1 hypothetical protein Thivi_3517 [Thiocystis violascens DSM 198]